MNNILKKISLISLFSINVIFGMESKILTPQEKVQKKAEDLKKIEDVLNSFTDISVAYSNISKEEAIENAKNGKAYATINTGVTFGKTTGYQMRNDLDFIRQLEIFYNTNLRPLLQKGQDLNILLPGAGQMSSSSAYLLHLIKNDLNKLNNSSKVNFFYNDTSESFYEKFTTRAKNNNLLHKNINIIPIIGDMFQLHNHQLIKNQMFNLVLEENSLHFFTKRQAEKDYVEKLLEKKGCDKDFIGIYNKYQSQSLIYDFVKNLYPMIIKGGRMIMKSRSVLEIPNTKKERPPLSTNSAQETDIVNEEEQKNIATKTAFYNKLDNEFVKMQMLQATDEFKLEHIVRFTRNLIKEYGDEISLTKTNVIPSDFFCKNGGLVDFFFNKADIPPFIRLHYICNSVGGISLVENYDLLKLKDTKSALMNNLNEHPLVTAFKALGCFGDARMFYQTSRNHQDVLSDLQLAISIQK